MKMLRRLLKVVCGLALVAGTALVLWAVVQGPVERARTFSSFSHAWTEHWPLERAKYLPLRFGPALTSMGLIGPVRVEIEPRVSLQLNPTDLVDMELLATGQWEPEVWTVASTYLKPGSTFVDVGAHIGIFTLRAAKAVGDQGRVISVEPNPLVASRLRENVQSSGWNNVQVHEVACGDTRGKLKLFPTSQRNTSAASLSQQNAEDQGGSARTFFEVDVVPLDELLAPLNLQRLDVMKVDTEGAETMILRGAQETLRRFRPVLMLEMDDHHLRNLNSSLAELESVLTAAGYVKGRQYGSNNEWVPAERRSPSEQQ